jgi:hypothetical protein
MEEEVMKKFLLATALRVALIAPVSAETYSPIFVEPHHYSCDLGGGKTSHLVVTDKVVLWRGKKYTITANTECGKAGLRAVGKDGTILELCFATKGVVSVDQPGQDDAMCEYAEERR